MKKCIGILLFAVIIVGCFTGLYMSAGIDAVIGTIVGAVIGSVICIGITECFFS